MGLELDGLAGSLGGRIVANVVGCATGMDSRGAIDSGMMTGIASSEVSAVEESGWRSASAEVVGRAVCESAMGNGTSGGVLYGGEVAVGGKLGWGGAFTVPVLWPMSGSDTSWAAVLADETVRNTTSSVFAILLQVNQ
jgi:hypothetical protein